MEGLNVSPLIPGGDMDVLEVGPQGGWGFWRIAFSSQPSLAGTLQGVLAQGFN